MGSEINKNENVEKNEGELWDHHEGYMEETIKENIPDTAMDYT